MKSRRLVPISASNEILDHIQKEEGLSDAEIAQMIGVRSSFIGMVRLGELPLTIEQVETIAESFGMRLTQFYLSMKPAKKPTTDSGKKWASFCDEFLRRADRVLAAMDGPKRAKRSA